MLIDSRVVGTWRRVFKTAEPRFKQLAESSALQGCKPHVHFQASLKVGFGVNGLNVHVGLS